MGNVNCLPARTAQVMRCGVCLLPLLLFLGCKVWHSFGLTLAQGCLVSPQNAITYKYIGGMEGGIQVEAKSRRLKQTHSQLQSVEQRLSPSELVL